MEKNNNNNKLEQRYIDNAQKDYEAYEQGGFEVKKTSPFSNIWKPLSKIIIALIFVCLIINMLNLQMRTNKNDYFDKIEGTWVDENNNYYEIYDSEIEMNQGSKDRPFYKGTVVNILETDYGYKIVTKGKQIEYKNTDELDKTVEKDLNLSIEIRDYTEEFKQPMTAIIGKQEHGIVRVENTKKED